MAFMSMVIVFLFLVIVILAAMGLAGLIVTTVSVIRRKKALRQGMKPHKAGLITGIVLMCIPVLIVGSVVLFFAVGGSGESSYKKAIGFRDALYTGLMDKDAGVIYEAFSPYAKEQNAVSYEDVDAMLGFLDGNVEGFTELLPSEYCEQYGTDGMFEIQSFHGEIPDAATDTGNTYEIYYFGYSQYDGDENRLGLEHIEIRCNGETMEIGIAPK